MQKFIVAFLMILLVAGSFTIVFGGLFFSMKGFFDLIGVSYESNGALVLFALYCFLIGLIFEVIEMIILYFIEKGNITKKTKSFWIIIVKFFSTWLVIHIVNEWMTTVTLSRLAEILTATLMVAIDIVFDENKRNKDDETTVN